MVFRHSVDELISASAGTYRAIDMRCAVVKQGEKYLVVTNRHVVENAHEGVVVHFLLGDRKGEEQRFTVPPDKLSVLRIHRSCSPDRRATSWPRSGSISAPTRGSPYSDEFRTTRCPRSTPALALCSCLRFVKA